MLSCPSDLIIIIIMLILELDQLSMQLKERFSDEQVGLMKEIALFASGALKSGAAIRQQISRTRLSHTV